MKKKQFTTSNQITKTKQFTDNKQKEIVYADTYASIL